MADNIESLKSKVEELQKEIAKLKSSIKKKKFGLVWLDVPESFGDEYENALPVLKEVPDKAIVNDDDKPTHILIEGDNYHALTCLNYTHKGKIDVIYIDPPYNTGAKDWKYNNNYVDENDPWRHSKWINFMANRLRIAKNLLKQSGVLICTIDHNELNTLGLLLKEIFADKEITCVTIVHNPSGIQGKNFSHNNEYAYFIYCADQKMIAPEQRGDKDADIRQFMNTAKGSSNNYLRESGINCFYPIIVKDEEIVGFGDVCEKVFHPDSPNIFREDGIVEVYPIDSSGVERKWVFSRQSVESIINELSVRKNNNTELLEIIRTKKNINYKTVWVNKKFSAKTYGTQLLNEIIEVEFPFPKSLFAVMECIRAVIHNKNDSVILDYFAGSGTTVHAVMEMNKQDGGDRQCIVCTNNENNICEEITYPRIEKVINGYEFEGKQKEVLLEKKLNLTIFKKSAKIVEEIEAIKNIEQGNFEKFETKIEDNHIRLIATKNITDRKEGLGGSLKYYKTDFIGGNNILNAEDKDKIELAHQAGDLLAIAENTLCKVEETDFWQVYENCERYTAVYFREELDEFEKFVEKVEAMEYPVTVYVFSWGDDEFEADFEHIEGVKVKTIPLPILEIYKSIYNLG